MAKLSKPNQIYYSIKSNIDKATSFAGDSLSGRELHLSMISKREIRLAVPARTTPRQWMEINRAIEYGKSKLVDVKVTQIK